MLLCECYPADGSNEDLRQWMLTCLAATLPHPPNVEQLISDLVHVNIKPRLFANCPLHAAIEAMVNWRYAACCLVVLPTTPGNSDHQREAWDLIVRFHHSVIIVILNLISFQTNDDSTDKSDQDSKSVINA